MADVLDGLFPFGTASMNRLQLQQALDAISAKESAGTSFSLSVPSVHFADGIALLADNQLHPALPAQAFAVVQNQMVGMVAGQLQSPDFLTELGLAKALLPANDLQLRHPTPQSVTGLTLDKVKSYYAQTFRPDMATIVHRRQGRSGAGEAGGGAGVWRVEGGRCEAGCRLRRSTAEQAQPVQRARYQRQPGQCADGTDHRRDPQRPDALCPEPGRPGTRWWLLRGRLYHDLHGDACWSTTSVPSSTWTGTAAPIRCRSVPTRTRSPPPAPSWCRT